MCSFGDHKEFFPFFDTISNKKTETAKQDAPQGSDLANAWQASQPAEVYI